ncbi:MAG: Kdo hydroxylase family protein [Nevskiales bacterium]
MRLTISASELATIEPHKISDALEQGNIVYFPECPITLPSDDDLAFMRTRMPELLKLKNISYHPESDKVYGIEGSVEEVERARRILSGHKKQVEAFLDKVAPNFTREWLVGTSTYRPLEEQGRNLSAHASNELIHVDAGAYGATHGDRVFRFFVNVNGEGKDRVWASKGSFKQVYERHGAAAGIAKPDIKEGLWDKFRTWLVTQLGKLNPVLKTALDSSPYDRAMRKMHNYMKDTPAFQADPHGHEEFHFPPGSAWMCFTDGVSHACLSGQHSFIDTYVVRLKHCRLPEAAPYHLLQKGL